MAATDVKTFSSINKNAPLCDIAIIRQLEEYLLSDCFTEGFYEALKADLVDYSIVVNYSNSMSYAIGDTVKLDGVFYVALKGTTGVVPPNLTTWEVGKKFKSDCFNVFFCEYLGYYIANNVFKTIEISQMKTSQLQLSKAEIDTYLKGIDFTISINRVNLFAYMKKTECLKKYLPNSGGSDCGCGEGETKTDCTVRKRRINFA
jgi:hypothetical protein